VKGVNECIRFGGRNVKTDVTSRFVAGGNGPYEAGAVSMILRCFLPTLLADDSYRLVEIQPMPVGSLRPRDSYRTASLRMVAAESAAEERKNHQSSSRFRENPWSPILGKTAFYPPDAYHQDYYKSDERLAFTSGQGLGVKKVRRI